MAAQSFFSRVQRKRKGGRGHTPAPQQHIATQHNTSHHPHPPIPLFFVIMADRRKRARVSEETNGVEQARLLFVFYSFFFCILIPKRSFLFSPSSFSFSFFSLFRFPFLSFFLIFLCCCWSRYLHLFFFHSLDAENLICLLR